MDTQSATSSRDDLCRLQNDMKTVFATQAEHAERLLRLERRQEDETRLKAVWGTSSPFPSILSGTPQQEPSDNPAAEAFKNFDLLDQTSNLLGSLQLDSEEEPRRGASRANSVRFDESALHGHFSRSSTDFFPLRTGSGLGSQPMTERSLSHKSDGRQSSGGHSTHSTRLNSLGYDIRFNTSNNANLVGPPPGLFILGPLPSIIRCWLDTNFTNESLLYAAVCTGSYKSVLSSRLAKQLGLDKQIFDRDGERRLKMQVYLPEATIQQTSLRSGSPAPQLPAITVDFSIQEMTNNADSIQIFLGSDLLRAQSADLLFSQERLTILDDARNRLAIPLVRPENALVFQNLLTVNTLIGSSQTRGQTDRNSIPTGLLRDDKSPISSQHLARTTSNLKLATLGPQVSHTVESPFSPLMGLRPKASTTNNRITATEVIKHGHTDNTELLDGNATSESPIERTTDLDLRMKPEIGNVWGSWRRDSLQSPRPDSRFSSATLGLGHDRTDRGRGMKVLKPARLSTSSRFIPGWQTPVVTDLLPPGSQENGSPTSSVTPALQDARLSRRSASSGTRSPVQLLTNKASSINPVGGASAFGWLNSSQAKQTGTMRE